MLNFLVGLSSIEEFLLNTHNFPFTDITQIHSLKIFEFKLLFNRLEIF